MARAFLLALSAKKMQQRATHAVSLHDPLKATHAWISYPALKHSPVSRRPCVSYSLPQSLQARLPADCRVPGRNLGNFDRTIMLGSTSNGSSHRSVPRSSTAILLRNGDAEATLFPVCTYSKHSPNSDRRWIFRCKNSGIERSPLPHKRVLRLDSADTSEEASSTAFFVLA